MVTGTRQMTCCRLNRKKKTYRLSSFMTMALVAGARVFFAATYASA